MQPSPRDEDRELARAIATGDSEATRVLCETYLPRLRGYIIERSGLDYDAVTDVTQETLLAVLRSAQYFRGESSLWTWICSIARRKVADHYRRSRHRPESLDRLTAEGLALVDKRPLPEETVMREETWQVVHRLLWRLPQGQRDAVLRKYVDERSVADIAAELGRSEKAVESLLSRGRATLRARLSAAGRSSLRKNPQGGNGE